MIYRTLILFSVVSAFSMQVCMDTPDWLKSLVHEESGTGSSSSSAELFACPRPPVLERRLRPQHDQALKCPRCDSTHTKFCYYNNYSLSQPRYFCKTCRRYWTKGGSLRNVPVGGGCRKNKRSGKKPAEQMLGQPQVVPAFHDGTDLHLSFAAVQPPHLDSLAETPRNFNFMACKYNLMLNAPTSNGELMEGKLGAMIGSTGSGSHMFMDGCEVGLGDVNHGLMPSSFNGVNPYGFSVDPGHASFMEACQRLALPFEGQEDPSAVDVKPGNRMLSLEWPEQGCGEVGRDSFGYSNGLGLWTGMINGHGPSTAI